MFSFFFFKHFHNENMHCVLNLLCIVYLPIGSLCKILNVLVDLFLNYASDSNELCVPSLP